MIDLHLVGGIEYMLPLSLLLLANLALIFFVLVRRFQKKPIAPKWQSIIKHIAGLALAWGAFSTMFGLVQAFNAIENAKEIIPLNVIMGGLKVASITVVYGLLIFCVSITFYVIIKWLKRDSTLEQ
jgi:hypothetical protein